MDLAMIIGLAGAFGSLVAMVFIEHASLTSLLLAGPMVLVFGATIAVGIAGSTVADAIKAFTSIPKALKGKRPDLEATIDQLIALTDKARHHGLLSLEDEAATVTDPFLKAALQGVADGADSEDLRGLLEDEIATQSKRDRTSAKFFSALGGYAPTIGIVGTVVSLTHVLANLSTPSKLGPMIASAFVATLWGLLSANFIWLPLGSRLHRLSDLEVDRMNLILEGVLAIQSGMPSRALGERLKAMAGYTEKKAAAAKGEKGRIGESTEPA